jgi:hypothetical protein
MNLSEDDEFQGKINEKANVQVFRTSSRSLELKSKGTPIRMDSPPIRT